MADQAFEAGFAIAIQSAFGTPNIPAAWGTASVTEADGAVRGDRDSGDAETGISFPEHTRVGRESARSGRTAGFDTFLRQEFDGFTIAYQRRGGGGAVTATPAAGEAKPQAGIDALNRALGLEGANGTAPVYIYTPAATPEYATVALWVGDRRYYYQDCLVSSRAETFTPGEVAIVTDTISIGSINAAANGITIPTFDYGIQDSLSAPVIAGVANTWNTVRGFETLEVSMEGNSESVGDSNVATSGQRTVVGGFDVTQEMRIYLDSGDTFFEYDDLNSATAPTQPHFFQVGTVATGGEANANAYEHRLPTPQIEVRKEDRTGTVVVLDCTLRARGSAAGSEYSLTYN